MVRSTLSMLSLSTCSSSPSTSTTTPLFHSIWWGVKEGVGEEGRRSRRREGDDGEGGDREEKNEKFYGILQLIGVSIHM